jgi:hypothetical protein
MSSRAGRSRGPYLTRRMRRELALQEMEAERQRAIRREAAKARARVHDAAQHRARRARLKAAGTPLPNYYKPEPPGSSTPRVYRWRDRQKAKREEAAREARIARRAELAARRAAKGLPPAKTVAQRCADYRARKKAEVAEQLASLKRWDAPQLSRPESVAIAEPLYANWGDAYQHLLKVEQACARTGLNVNFFTLQTGGVCEAMELRNRAAQTGENDGR